MTLDEEIIQMPEGLPKWHAELIFYLKECFNFHKEPIDVLEILRNISAFSARASWLRNLVVRQNGADYSRFRIDELDPFLVEVDRQFKTWSRHSTVSMDEYTKSKG